MRTLNLNALTQGIQRLREKGSPDQQSLYDLVNGYVAIDGSIRQRPGTEFVATLPTGTHGLIAHRGQQVVFSIAPKTMPTGFRCEVVTNPDDPADDIKRVWFAAPFLGEIYAAVEFLSGKVYHFWLNGSSGGSTWQADHVYQEGEIVVPGNGLAYRAKRLNPAAPAWQANEAHGVGDVREPTVSNGYQYTVASVAGDTPRSGETEPVWPAEDGGVVVERADAPPAVPPSTPPPGTGGGGGGSGCPSVDAYVIGRCGPVLAGSVQVGDELLLCDPETGEESWGVVSYSERIQTEGVRIVGADGSLTCTTTAPIPTDVGFLLAPETLGHTLPTRDAEGTIGSELVAQVIDVGAIEAQHITVGDRCFWAGDDGAYFFLHHNLKSTEDRY